MKKMKIILTFAYELLKCCRLSPLLLFKPFATSRTLGSTGIMLASAKQFLRHLWIQYVASIRMAITHTSTTNTDIFDGIKILKYNNSIVIFYLLFWFVLRKMAYLIFFKKSILLFRLFKKTFHFLDNYSNVQFYRTFCLFKLNITNYLQYSIILKIGTLGKASIYFWNLKYIS